MRGSYWFFVLMACESGVEFNDVGTQGGCVALVDSDYGDYNVGERFTSATADNTESSAVVVLTEGVPSLHVEPEELTLTYLNLQGQEVVISASFVPAYTVTTVTTISEGTMSTEITTTD